MRINLKRKTVSRIMLALLSIAMLSFAFHVNSVQAEDITKAVVLDSWGADYSIYTIYPGLNIEWSRYGSRPILIDWAGLNKEDITYSDLALTGADVLIISHAYPRPEYVFTDTEIAAIKQYVEEGHGIIGTYGTLVPENNRKLAELFGMDPSVGYIFYPLGEISTGTFNILQLSSPLFNSLPNPFSVPTVSETMYVPSHDWTVEGIVDGTIVALTTDNEAAIITGGTTYKSVYFTNQMEEKQTGMPETSIQVFYNAIVWADPHMPGDVNADSKVDGKDIVLVAQAFGSYPTHPKWNSRTDLNHDGKIDGRDIVSVAKYFGETYS